MMPLREAAQQALDALEGVVRVADRATQEFADARTAIADLRAALAEPVPHGCHCDLEDDMAPDGCVLDDGNPDECVYARPLLRQGKGKTDCDYWQPIRWQK
jgi:hypothetical protein